MICIAEPFVIELNDLRLVYCVTLKKKKQVNLSILLFKIYLDVGIEPTVYTRIYVETSEEPDVRDLYRKKVLGSKRSPDKIWIPTEAGVLSVRDQEGFVYITGVATGYEFVRKHFLAHQICELNEIPLRDASHTHTVLAKRSPYAELIKLRWA